MYLKLLCSLISVIVKTALGPRQALRNLSHMFVFPSLLEKISQYWSAFSAEYCRTNPAGGKEQEFFEFTGLFNSSKDKKYCLMCCGMLSAETGKSLF